MRSGSFPSKQLRERLTTGTVLLVDGDEQASEVIAAGLRCYGFEAALSISAAEALEYLRTQEFDALIVDTELEEIDTSSFCEQARLAVPDLPIVLVTHAPCFDVAVQGLRAGVSDIFAKPVDLIEMAQSLGRAIQNKQSQDRLRRLERPEREDRIAETGKLVGKSPVMKQAHYLLESAAESDVTVLITGESGTGKELAARAIHKASLRKDGPFVALNCAAVPETLLESELFGHARGAFTDAKSARTGLFVQANHGTILLDEIGEMPIGMQAKLLRVLQERKVKPVGADREIPFDARIITSTNRSLETAVEEGRFREDLFFRINVVSIVMPPLRDRGEDVLILAQHCLERAANTIRKPIRGLTPEVADRLLRYDWPGNVRELQNAMESAVALTRFDRITEEDLPERIREYTYSPISKLRVGSHTRRNVAGNSAYLGRKGYQARADASDGGLGEEHNLVPLEEVERRHILHVLEATGGNRALAARMLGLDRKTLYRKLERWGVERAS